MRALYRANMAKALEVILWVAHKRPSADFHKILKVLFFADKAHLNKYGRPIVGGRYLADEYGPVCAPVHDIMRGEPLAIQMVHCNWEIPFRVENKFRIIAERCPNMRLLSKSDVDALEESFNQYGHLSFDELVDISHDDPAYLNADGIEMSYEDFLEDTPDKESRIADLREVSRVAVV